MSFLEMQSSKGKLQVNKEQRGLRMSTGSCQPEFMDFTNDKWNGMILKNTFSSSQDFYQKYNGGLKAQVTFEIDGANMDIISDPNGKNPFLAKFHCVNSNSLCSPTTSGLTFHVKASIGGTTKTWYKVVAKNCGVEWHDCKSTSKFPCDTRRRRLLSKRRGGC